MKAEQVADLRCDVDIKEDVEVCTSASVRKGKRPRMDESVDEVLDSGKEAFSRDHRDRVISYLCRWAYVANIPFNAFQTKECWKALEAVGQYGPGLKPPTRYEITVPHLKNAVKEIDDDLQNHREMWKATSCSIMIDSWNDDARGRIMMHLCVNCSLGTSFFRSIDSSKEAHTEEYIFKLVDECIQEVGVQNVMQVVTNNAPANIAAGKLVVGKYPRIFWNSCAVHCIDLVLEEMEKIPKVRSVISKARKLTVFIYSHTQTLSMMRQFTQQKDIVRRGKTRFATTFFTLQRILEMKEKIRLMFSSDDWSDCRWSKTRNAEVAASIVFSISFWDQVVLSLRVFTPLVRLLRLVDSDKKPSMGFVYGRLEEAKREIIDSFNGNETSYKPFIDAIVLKTTGVLDTPLHLAAYYLNPYYFYKNRLDNNCQAIAGLLDCIEKFFPDLDAQDTVAMKELIMFKNAQGQFGRPLAVRQRDTIDEHSDPAEWWYLYGNETPKLQEMAIKILSLTSSSLGCERDWSVVGTVNSQNRSKLDHKKINDLMYVRFNALIKERNKGGKRDALSSKDPIHAKAWLSNVPCEDEVLPDLTSGVVAEVSGTHEVSQPRTSGHTQFRGSSSCQPQVYEEEEEDFDFENEEIEEEDGDTDDEEVPTLLEDDYDDDDE